MFKVLIRTGLWAAATVNLLAACGQVEEHSTTEIEPAVETTQRGALGADLCKDVDLTFRNSRERDEGNVSIRIRRVKFFSEHDDRWHSEDFTNRIVGYGDSVTVDNQDLENVYFEDLIDWKVYYNVLQPNGRWGSEVHQNVTYSGQPRCENYRGYYLIVN